MSGACGNHQIFSIDRDRTRSRDQVAQARKIRQEAVIGSDLEVAAAGIVGCAGVDADGAHVSIDQTAGHTQARQVVAIGDRAVANRCRRTLAVDHVPASTQVGPGRKREVGGFVRVVAEPPLCLCSPCVGITCGSQLTRVDLEGSAAARGRQGGCIDQDDVSTRSGSRGHAAAGVQQHRSGAASRSGDVASHGQVLGQRLNVNRARGADPRGGVHRCQAQSIAVPVSERAHAVGRQAGHVVQRMGQSNVSAQE